MNIRPADTPTNSRFQPKAVVGMPAGSRPTDDQFTYPIFVEGVGAVAATDPNLALPVDLQQILAAPDPIKAGTKGRKR